MVKSTPNSNLLVKSTPNFNLSLFYCVLLLILTFRSFIVFYSISMFMVVLIHLFILYLICEGPVSLFLLLDLAHLSLLFLFLMYS